jgi:GNAT superfamily N-acetyltransferase
MATVTGPPIILRELRRGDAPTFIQSVILGYGPFERMLGLDRQGPDLYTPVFRPGIWYVLRLLRLLGVAPVRFLVAVDGGTVVGTTGLSRWRTAGYIFAVGVRPSHQRRGLARRMLDWAESTTARRGVRWAVLDVEEDNVPAVTLYRARGYATFETVHWFRRHGTPPPSVPPVSSMAVTTVPKSQREVAADWCRAHVPPHVGEIVPPEPTRLSHLETLGSFPGSLHETWAAGPVGAPLAYLTGARRTPGEPGLLTLVAADPAATADDLARLVDEGAAWLRRQGASATLVALPDYLDRARPALERAGFAPQLATLAMARPLRGAEAPAAGPKGP